MSKVALPKKVLDIFADHIAAQEAEIERLNNLLSDFRDEFGLIDLSSSPEFQKAKLERQLQEIRKKNNEMQLQLRTNQSQQNTKQRTVTEMERALNDLMKDISTNKSEEFKSTEVRVNKMDQLNEKLDKGIIELEETMKTLLQQNRREK